MPNDLLNDIADSVGGGAGPGMGAEETPPAEDAAPTLDFAAMSPEQLVSFAEKSAKELDSATATRLYEETMSETSAGTPPGGEAAANSFFSGLDMGKMAGGGGGGGGGGM